MKNLDQWTVVIIDDEPDIREVVSIVLSDSGFCVQTAENGQHGIELCRKLNPQIVLTDIKMPGMDGLKVLEHLKLMFQDIEVIVMTAFGELEHVIRALQLDASDFITKPLHEDALHLALKRAMDRYTSKKKLQEYTKFLEQENITQAKLLHRDKMISLGRLSASVVHEINNPLAGILNYAKLMNRILKKERLTDGKITKFSAYLDLIESESARISEIVSGLLTFSRKNAPVVSAISVSKLIDKCILLSRHRMKLGKIELKCNIEAELPEFNGDFNQLQQCLINLIFNAIDAMPQGGHLEINVFYDKEKRYIYIQVKDTGHGIESENMKKIFEPFFTTKAEEYGVGLGLSIIFGIMESHGGYVDVESSPGKGSSFTLRLPVQVSAKGGYPDRSVKA